MSGGRDSAGGRRALSTSRRVRRPTERWEQVTGDSDFLSQTRSVPTSHCALEF